MMFEEARANIQSRFQSTPWVAELAGVLPLSALIDFLDPQVLHIYQLTGAVPRWCWPVTPSGSRLLYSEPVNSIGCCLDRANRRHSLTCIDGRYGDEYETSIPETLRLCLAACSSTIVKNDHSNMQLEDKRPQNLKFVHVTLDQSPREAHYSRTFHGLSFIGYLVWASLLVLSGIMGLWIAMGFLVGICLTGTVINLLHGGKLTRLVEKDAAEKMGGYNRLIVAASHMNETNWQVYYGESTLINRLVNRSLRTQRKEAGLIYQFLQPSLRFLILTQWGLALGASAKKSLDGYIVTFWIVFCILSHVYLFSARHSIKQWLETSYVKFDVYDAELSTRRALLNTIVALNPDTFSDDAEKQTDATVEFSPGAIKWINPILKPSHDRELWELATRDTMVYGSAAFPAGNEEGGMVAREQSVYETKHWLKFISEGIQMAQKLKQAADLSGRLVVKKNAGA